MTIAWPPMLPALLFVTASTPALEAWGWPDLREHDKQEHAGIGFAVGAISVATTKSLSPRSTWWTRALIGVAASAIVGAAKEAVDSRTHDADPKDALATVVGGAAGALSISLAWRF